MHSKKPKKKTDRELYRLLEAKISNKEYVFLDHAKKRLKDRKIIDIDVLDLLEGKKGRGRKRNKSKDKYEDNNQDWNYCIEGCDISNLKIRVIVSFEDEDMLVITVIALFRKGVLS